MHTTHTAQHSRKTRYTRSQKTLGFILLAVVALTVSFLWIVDLGHGTNTVHVAHHILTHPATHKAVKRASSAAAKAAAAKAAAGAAGAAVGVKVGIKVGLKHYTVKAGDTLWGIAKVKLHNPLLWRKLYALNIHVIGSNPNAIVAGQSLLL